MLFTRSPARSLTPSNLPPITKPKTNSYYAHLAAFRGRLMVQFGGGAGDTASEVSGSSGGKRAPAQMLAISEELSRRMFYV